MWKIAVIALLLSMAGCAQLPPHPLDSQAKQFQPVSDKAVIYVFRPSPDFGSYPVTISFDGIRSSATYPGTYLRWEVAPGEHSITGVGHDTGAVKLNVAAGKIYFVRQAVWGHSSSAVSFLSVVDERSGKAGVQDGTMLTSF